MNRFLQLIACSLLSIALTLGVISWQVQRITDDPAGLVMFLRSVNLVKRNFDGPVDDAKLFSGAIDGMVKTLDDPYTEYLDEKEYKELSELTTGSFCGIGIIFGKKDEGYVVISTLPDNPGAAAGIKGGDRIIAVDGKSTESLNMEEVSNLIRGAEGTELKMKLVSKSGKERIVRLVRQKIKNPSVGSYMLPETKIGVLRIAAFNENTGEEFAEAYQKLEKEGMQATVLDLRGNPGGLLDAGVSVAGMLVPKGPIVSVIYKDGTKLTEESQLEGVKYPLVVLIDHGSASATEIVAGAIKDTKAGYLIGEKSFGKGSVQSIIGLDGKTALKITSAKYYTPSGVSIHHIGIEPDLVVSLPENGIENEGSVYVTDTQMQAAKKYLLEKIAEEAQ